jgi:hypothetical protein
MLHEFSPPTMRNTRIPRQVGDPPRARCERPRVPPKTGEADLSFDAALQVEMK